MNGYVFNFEGATFTPEGKIEIETNEAVEAHNEAVEAVELEDWAKQPNVFTVYADNKGKVTTWLGTKLGTVIHAHTHSNGFGHTPITYLRVKGTNGATYYGKYGSDWSQAVNLRKCKSLKLENVR